MPGLQRLSRVRAVRPARKRLPVALAGVTASVIASLSFAALAGGAATGATHSAIPGTARRFSARGTIVRLAADGDRVAVSTRGIKNACDRILVWNAHARTFRRFVARTHCPNSGVPVFEFVGEIALGGGRLAWIEGAGGINLELSLYVAPLSGGPKSSKRLDFASNGNGAGGDADGDYLGQLLGADALLLYNSWHVCTWTFNDGMASPGCPVDGGVSQEKLLRIGGGKPVQVTSGPSALRLAAVGGGRLALLTKGATMANGDSLAIRSARGVLVATIAAKPGEAIRRVALSASRLVVQRSHALDVYDPATGEAVTTLALGSDLPLQLAGTGAGLALLKGLHRLRLVRLSDGKRVTLPLATAVSKCFCPVDAKLTGSGLFYAYNVRKSSARGRIVFWPNAQLLARF